MKFLVLVTYLLFGTISQASPVVQAKVNISQNQTLKGTGFFITPAHLLTVKHLCSEGQVYFEDKDTIYSEESKVISTKYDLCLVTLDKPFIHADLIPPRPSGSYYNGQISYIGYPHGVLTVSFADYVEYLPCIENETVTCGFSVLNAYPGASGSPVIGVDGKLVGVVVKLNTVTFENMFETVDSVRDFLDNEVLNQEQ